MTAQNLALVFVPTLFQELAMSTDMVRLTRELIIYHGFIFQVSAPYWAFASWPCQKCLALRKYIILGLSTVVMLCTFSESHIIAGNWNLLLPYSTPNRNQWQNNTTLSWAWQDFSSLTCIEFPKFDHDHLFRPLIFTVWPDAPSICRRKVRCPKWRPRHSNGKERWRRSSLPSDKWWPHASPWVITEALCPQ